jgi:hypothetical protein
MINKERYIKESLQRNKSITRNVFWFDVLLWPNARCSLLGRVIILVCITIWETLTYFCYFILTYATYCKFEIEQLFEITLRPIMGTVLYNPPHVVMWYNYVQNVKSSFQIWIQKFPIYYFLWKNYVNNSTLIISTEWT